MKTVEVEPFQPRELSSTTRFVPGTGIRATDSTPKAAGTLPDAGSNFPNTFHSGESKAYWRSSSGGFGDRSTSATLTCSEHHRLPPSRHSSIEVPGNLPSKLNIRRPSARDAVSSNPSLGTTEGLFD